MFIDTEQGKATLKDLLRFCSGLEAIPPTKYCLNTWKTMFCLQPLPVTKFLDYQLPVIVDKRTSFKQMDTGVLGSKGHFRSKLLTLLYAMQCHKSHVDGKRILQ